MANATARNASNTEKEHFKAGDGSSASPYSDVPNGIGHGRAVVVTPGTPVVLGAPTRIKRVHITPRLGNTELVVVGGSGVLAGTADDSGNTRVGTVLLPGGLPFSFEVDNLNKVYVDAVTAGDGVTFSYETMT